jgi:phospholipid-transporting ATPase
MGRCEINRQRREIVVGRPQYCVPSDRVNFVSTRRYNWVTFFPVSLLYQFRQASNCYFLFIAVLVMIPGIAPVNPFASVLPLVFVIAVSEARELWEEIQSGRRDRKVNSTEVNLLAGRRRCDKLKPGDLVMLKRDSKIPADMLVLTTSSPDGTVFVETANLDGETNLRLKRSPVSTQKADLVDFSTKTIGESDFIVGLENPHLDMYTFKGSLRRKSDDPSSIPEQLSITNVLFRGCTVRNTEWVLGVVIYVGHETKVLMNTANAGNAPSKTTFIHQIMNRNVFVIILFQLILCITAASVGVAAQSRSVWYMGSSEGKWSSLFFSYFVLLNTLIPVSLWVSVEFLRLAQAHLMQSDACANIVCNAKNLHEELGNITHIFSDKTGTLTVNKMKFVGCSVAGKMYSLPDDEDDEIPALSRSGSSNSESSGTLRLPFPGVLAPSPDLMKMISGNITDTGSSEYFLILALALCHSCERVVEEFTGSIRNQSSSPDEAALVAAAAEAGIVFTGRPSAEEIELEEIGEQKRVFKLLHTIQFTSERRMMTVVVQSGEGDVFIFSKGADSSVIPKCTSGPIDETIQTVQNFSVFGYRTLVVAMRRMSLSEWNEGFGEKPDDALVETDLTLIGSTAVEDRLQSGVPETLRALRAAGIKVCMITGDKRETAINIAMSCGLITSKRNVHVMLGRGEEDVKSNDGSSTGSHQMGGGAFVPLYELEQIAKDDTRIADPVAREYWKRETQLLGLTDRQDGSVDHWTFSESSRGFSLVIDGGGLKYILSCDAARERLVDVLTFEQCESVVFCRVSPKQKGDIVRLVKSKLESRGKSTLAIGDGANDVNMITAANVGVGIAGNEGSQAANSADYAIKNFADVYRLLFVHGRLNYRRTSWFVTIFLYKNIAFFMCQFWFGTISQFSSQTSTEGSYMLLFNSVFGILPLFIFGTLDKDVDFVDDAPGGRNEVAHPPYVTQSYWREMIVPKLFAQQEKLSNRKMLSWCLLGVIHSIILFYGVQLAWTFNLGAITAYAAPASAWMASILSYTIEIFVVSAITLWISAEWTKLLVISIWVFNIALYFLFVAVYDYINPDGRNFVFRIAGETLCATTFWLVLPLITVILIAPLVGWSHLRAISSPKTSLATCIGLLRKMTYLNTKHENSTDRPV